MSAWGSPRGCLCLLARLNQKSDAKYVFLGQENEDLLVGAQRQNYPGMSLQCLHTLVGGECVPYLYGKRQNCQKSEN